jgi:hypothetical protein
MRRSSTKYRFCLDRTGPASGVRLANQRTFARVRLGNKWTVNFDKLTWRSGSATRTNVGYETRNPTFKQHEAWQPGVFQEEFLL